MKVDSEIFVLYQLKLGLEFILQDEEFLEVVEILPIKNISVIEDIHIMRVLVNTIHGYIRNVKKIKYHKLVDDLYELINNTLIDSGEVDLGFDIDKEIIELIIKDLNRIDLIDLKGKKVVKYNQ